jgi:hypothetical protein
MKLNIIDENGTQHIDTQHYDISMVTLSILILSLMTHYVSTISITKLSKVNKFGAQRYIYVVLSAAFLLF